MSSEPEIARAYDALAEEYDEAYSTRVDRAEDEHMRRLLAPLLRGALLDVGCGTGLVAGLIPERVEYVGVDISPGMIEVAKRNHPRRTFFAYPTDVSARVLADDYFGLATCFYGVLSEAPDPESVLRMIVRKLWPGGLLVLSVGTARHARSGLTIADGAVDYRPYRIPELRALVRRTGFEVVDVYGLNVLGWQLGLLPERALVPYLDREAETLGRWYPHAAHHLILVAQKRFPPFPPERLSYRQAP